jgi:UDP-N-acetylmuramate dehydrogenase
LILGGGSNVLFTKDYDGLVVKNSLLGIEKVREDPNHVWLKVQSGENWHQFVDWCIGQNYGGIENLSLIPGLIGAAPMQNIGAYGVEIKSVFHELEAVDIRDGTLRTFHRDDCEFGYRESVFKKSLKGCYCIVSVTLKLDKHPQFNISYGAIQENLEKMKIKNLTLRAVSDAVISIRQSKLPDPKEIGNAGSFFKNPEVENLHFDKIKSKYPEMPGYPLTNQKSKIPAGWLIEKCGWKGKVVGNTGAHKDQALVLVNYGKASGIEIKNLSQEIQRSVFEKFGIELMGEVNII